MPVSLTRDVLLPSSLNYFGLLGYGKELDDFGTTTLFYDDLILYRPSKEISFRLNEPATISIKLS